MDRTRVADALIRDTLGVPREIIVQDFQETERRAGFADSEPKMRAFLGDAGYERLGEEGRRAMWRADPIFIDAAFDSLIQPYGSVDKIGRASCRERVCQYVSISVVAVLLQKKKK